MQEIDLEILQRASEIKQSFHKNGTKADWSEIEEMLCNEFHDSSITCDENFRCKVKSFEKKNGILRSKEDVKNQEIDDKLYEIEVATINLKKEKVKLQDEKTRFQKLIRDIARKEELNDIIINEIKSLNELKPLPISPIELKKTNKTGILQLSDWHYSLTTNNFLNEYNIQVFERRITEVITKTIHYAKVNDIEELIVLLQGDFISSSIHNILRVVNQTDVVSQIMETSEVIANIISSLQETLKIKVKVSYVLDNHSRVTSDKKESLDKENYMRLTDWFLRNRLINNKNVEFLESELGIEFSKFEVYGSRCISVHGHKDKFGTIVPNLSAYTRDIYDYIFTSHNHHLNAEEMNMCLVISNGSLSGVDEYSGSLRMSSHPLQMFSIFVKDYGLQQMYPIFVK